MAKRAARERRHRDETPLFDRDLKVFHFVEDQFLSLYAATLGSPVLLNDPFLLEELDEEERSEPKDLTDDAYYSAVADRKCMLKVSAPTAHSTVTDASGRRDEQNSYRPLDPPDARRYKEFKVRPCDRFSQIRMESMPVKTDCVWVSFGGVLKWNGRIDVICRRIRCGQLETARTKHSLYYNGMFRRSSCLVKEPPRDAQNQPSYNDLLFTKHGGELLAHARSTGTRPIPFDEKIFVRASGCKVEIIAEFQAKGGRKNYRSSKRHVIDCCAECDELA